MNRLLPLLLPVAIGLGAQGAAAQDVGISLQFSQPGVYGRVDIGNLPQPQVIVPQPMLVAPPPQGVAPPAPVYMWVPREHREHWDRYCREYHACGHPVYFVNHNWYRDQVMAHREEYERGHGRGEMHREEMRHEEMRREEGPRGEHRGREGEGREGGREHERGDR